MKLRELSLKLVGCPLHRRLRRKGSGFTLQTLRGKQADVAPLVGSGGSHTLLLGRLQCSISCQRCPALGQVEAGQQQVRQARCCSSQQYGMSGAQAQRVLAGGQVQGESFQPRRGLPCSLDTNRRDCLGPRRLAYQLCRKEPERGLQRWNSLGRCFPCGQPVFEQQAVGAIHCHRDLLSHRHLDVASACSFIGPAHFKGRARQGQFVSVGNRFWRQLEAGNKERDSLRGGAVRGTQVDHGRLRSSGFQQPGSAIRGTHRFNFDRKASALRKRKDRQRSSAAGGRHDAQHGMGR